MSKEINIGSSFLKSQITVSVGFFSLLTSAIGIWFLDIFGLDVWIAHTFGDFISLVAERV